MVVLLISSIFTLSLTLIGYKQQFVIAAGHAANYSVPNAVVELVALILFLAFAVHVVYTSYPALLLPENE
jgi:putative Ca2+/H+ antiporter (TMEM165/GDT1 family)